MSLADISDRGDLNVDFGSNVFRIQHRETPNEFLVG